MDMTVCLACVLVSAICLAFILSIGFIIILFSRKIFRKLDSDLNKCFQKLEVILELLKCQEETKNNLCK